PGGRVCADDADAARARAAARVRVATPEPPRRNVGLRPPGADAAHAVHGDRVRRAAQARVRRVVPAHGRLDSRRAPGFEILHPADYVREPHRPIARAPRLRTHRRGGASRGRRRTLGAGGLGPPLSSLYVRGARRAAPRRTVAALTPVSAVLLEAGQAVLALVLAPALLGLIRRLKARLQGRRGAPISQPYFELRKLFAKEVVVSTNASWVFRATPYILFASTVAVTLFVPLVSVPLPFDAAVDLLVVAYLLPL